MVEITNGIIVTRVPNSAYEKIFKHQGYCLVDGGTTADEGEATGSDIGVNEDDIFVAQVQEKPLSQWSKDEVKRYAAIKGIDISDTKNPNEAKHIIKAYMSEHSDD